MSTRVHENIIQNSLYCDNIVKLSFFSVFYFENLFSGWYEQLIEMPRKSTKYLVLSVVANRAQHMFGPCLPELSARGQSLMCPHSQDFMLSCLPSDIASASSACFPLSLLSIFIMVGFLTYKITSEASFLAPQLQISRQDPTFAFMHLMYSLTKCPPGFSVGTFNMEVAKNSCLVLLCSLCKSMYLLVRQKY